MSDTNLASQLVYYTLAGTCCCTRLCWYSSLWTEGPLEPLMSSIWNIIRNTVTYQLLED
jgi:hypothetical protein